MDSQAVSIPPCPQCAAGCDPRHVYCPACGFPVGEVSSDRGDRLVGRTLPGGYQVLDLLSVGGMGRVYRAEQRALGRTVAVKVIHPHLLSDENSTVRFMTEARAASQLNHPNSVSVIDFGRTEDGQPYLVMEFLRGKDLAHVAYEQGPFPFGRIVDVLCQVLAALGEAHELHIVHRDIKPENIIVEPMRRGGDFVKVVDFGLAKLREETGGIRVTLPGIVCGTPDYMSPEQGRGDALDGRSDLYGLGIVYFQLLTGRLPFEHDNPTQVVLMHLSNPVPDPNEVAPDRNIPKPLVDVLFRSLAKDANDRFRDAMEFSDALQQALQESRSAQVRASLLPDRLVECTECRAHVPLTRFCGECGARLPARPDCAASAGSRLPALPLRLQDREQALAWLGQRRAESTRALTLAFIEGDAGIGKSRLLSEFLDRAREGGDRVVEVGPDLYCADIALHGVRQAMTGLVGAAALKRGPKADDAAAAGVRLVLRGITEPGASPGERRTHVRAALLWALVRARAAAPDVRIVVAIEDLERVDKTSRRAFQEVFHRDSHLTNVLVVATCEAATEAERWPLSQRLPLPGLSASLVERLVGERPVGGRQVDERTGAVTVAPLYVDQLVRFLAEGGNEPPARLADLVTHRLGRLKPGARRLLQALAVLGAGASDEGLQVLLGDAELKVPLEQLALANMVEQSGGRVSISHPLFRDLVLSATPLEVRRELHRRALRLFTDKGAPLEARALHAYHAQEAFQALLLNDELAAVALGREDPSSAVIALRRALDLARQELSRGNLEDPLRAMVLFGRKLGEALIAEGNRVDADGVLRETLDLMSPSDPERPHLLETLAGIDEGKPPRSAALRRAR